MPQKKTRVHHISWCKQVVWHEHLDGQASTRAAIDNISHPTTDARVLVCCDDLTFAGANIELNITGSKIREWYDLKVCGVLGSNREGT